VKQAVLDSKYSAIVAEMFAQHLQKQNVTAEMFAQEMVVFQEGNAGPHTEKEYSEWMQTTFNELGWHIELQAPQGKLEYDTVLCTRLLLYVFLLNRSLYQRATPISLPFYVAPA
jgi:hypothetical protein